MNLHPSFQFQHAPATEQDNPSYCLKYCYTSCNSQYVFNHPPHKYKLNDLVFGSQPDYDLAKEICKRLLSQNSLDLNNADYDCSIIAFIHECYAQSIQATAGISSNNDNNNASDGDDNNVNINDNSDQELKLASTHYLRSLELHSKKYSVHKNYAIMLERKLHDYKTAEKYYVSALQLSPEDVGCNRSYAQFLCNSVSKYQESVKHWEKADMDGTGDVSALLSFGKTLFHVGRFEECKLVLENVIWLSDSRDHDSYDYYNDECNRMFKYITAVEGVTGRVANSNSYSYLNRLIVEKVERNDNDCFEMWFNNENISILTVVTFMILCEIPIESLIEFIDKKRVNQNGDDVFIKKQQEIVNLAQNYILPLVVKVCQPRKLEFEGEEKEKKNDNENENEKEKEKNSDNAQLPMNDVMKIDGIEYLELENKQDGFEVNHDKWTNTNEKLRNVWHIVCNLNETDNENINWEEKFLNEYHEVMGLIKQQRECLENEWQSNMKDIANERQRLHVCQIYCMSFVLFFFFFFLVCFWF